jgi:GNAT superfamily N-acetyltransferase
MEIEQIDPTRSRQINQFLTFPLKHYRKSPFWVCPLLSDQKKYLQPGSPFFEHANGALFLARDSGEIVGRIGAVVNHRYNEFHNEKTGFFGYWECIDDQEVANLMFDTAADYLRKQGMDVMRGPASFSTNEECGLLVEGFDTSPMLLMPYNPRYYIGLMENYGFGKAMDLLAYRLDKQSVSERVERGAQLLEKRLPVKVRSFKKREYWDEAKKILEVYNNAWAKNWGFVPWTEREFFHLAKSMKSLADLDLVFIAEDGDRPVGFTLALPDANQALKHINGRLTPWALIKLLYYSRRIDQIRILIMGVVKEYRNRGIDNLFHYHIVKTGTAKGYKMAEMSWILENNAEMNRVLEKMGATVYKRYRLYDYPLNKPSPTAQ